MPYPLFNPMELGTAITAGHYTTVKYNLINLVTDAEYRRENYSDQDFNGFIECALDQEHWDILLLLFTYLPQMGITLPAESPFECVNTYRNERNTSIEKQIQELKLSASQEQLLIEFDADRYRAQHDFIADRKQTDATYETFIKAIVHGTLNDVEQNFRSLLAQRFYFNISIKYNDCREIYTIFERCIYEKNTNLLLLLWAWLPKLDYVLPENNPFKIYQNILNELLDEKIILTAEVEYKLKAYNQESYKINFFDSFGEENLGKNLPFIAYLERGLFKNNIDVAKAYARLAQLIKAMLKEMIPQSSKFQLHLTLDELVAGNRLLCDIFRPYSNPLTHEPVIFNNALVKLDEAINFNDGETAKSALSILTKRGRLTVDEIFSYCRFQNSWSILESMIVSRCYPVIRELCFENQSINATLANEVLTCVQKCIIKYKLGGYPLYLLLCTDPSLAHKYLLSPSFLLKMADEDLFRFDFFSAYRFRTDRYYKGEEQSRFLDIMFKQMLTLSTKLTSDLEVRYNFAQFVRENLPGSSTLLGELFLPLAMKQQATLSAELALIPHHHPDILQPIVNTSGGAKYLIHTLKKPFNYKFEENGQNFYVTLTPFGFITITPEHLYIEKNKEQNIEHSKAKVRDKKIKAGASEEAIAVATYSSRRLKLKKVTGNQIDATTELSTRLSFFEPGKKSSHGPIFPNQTPTVVSNKRYIPIAISQMLQNGSIFHSGFWGNFEIYGGKEEDNKPQLMAYKAILTTACMMGVTFLATLKNAKGETKTISLTHPGAEDEIEPGFKIVTIACQYKPHLYEKYTITQLREVMPFFKDVMQPNGKIYHGLPTANYINYGIRYYLLGVFNREQLIEYILTIRQHDKWYRNEFKKLSDEFGIEIVTHSTLDGLGFATKMTPDQIVDDIDEQIQDIPEATPREKELKLVIVFLENLKKIDGNVGEIYSNMPDSIIKKELLDSDKPLLALNYLDYQAVIAYAKLESAKELGKPQSDEVLGFYPTDETHIFTKFGTNFQQYSPLEAIDWIPTIMPQDETKMFYMKNGVNTFNQLIDKYLVHFQGMIANAIANNNAAFYLTCFIQIMQLLIDNGFQEQIINKSPTI